MSSPQAFRGARPAEYRTARPPRDRLRAPREDREVVAEPSLGQVPTLLDDNRRLLAQAGVHLLGRPLDELRREARASALHAARAYFTTAGEPLPDAATDSLLLAGHQPELFHPGVWVKNFALNGLARRHSATPLNLVVDNDTARTTLLRVPSPQHDNSGSDGAAAARSRFASIPFDQWVQEAPYEERPVRDEELFASTPERVRAALGGVAFEPLLPAFWLEVLSQARRTPLLGERFAAARRAIERRWGCHNFELPVSTLCGTPSFAWFAGHLLAHLPQFHSFYNEAVRRYRRTYGIRSRNHPVPDLATNGDWLETPFWAWRTGQGRRRRLWARRAGAALELRAGDELWPSLPFPEDGGTQGLVSAWQELHNAGLKIRSRALTTTLYARVFLADLFIHGIGGGKYDELTDELIRRFYGVEAPGFLVLSATLLLPLADAARRTDCRGLKNTLRDLHYNPQRHLGPEAASGELVARRQELVGMQPTDRTGRRERYRQLRRLTEALRPYVAGREEAVRQELMRCVEEVRTAAVLRRRDYAFCLHPEVSLRPFLTGFLSPETC
ncbi:MAG TPA: hypothetical protein VEL76_04065 [Gemmataceae bacterium]|nr:hypothetical protein [Gemmataceae bacterium]